MNGDRKFSSRSIPNPRKRLRLNSGVAKPTAFTKVGNSNRDSQQTSKQQITSLQQELQNAMEAKNKAQQKILTLQNQFKQELSKKDGQISALHSRMKEVFNEEKRVSKELSDLTERSTHKEEISNAQIQSLEKNNSELRSELNSVSDTLRLKENEFNSNHIAATAEIHKCKEIIAAQNEKLIEMDESNVRNATESKEILSELDFAKKHISQLQQQLQAQKEHVKTMANAECEGIRLECEQKIRDIATRLQSCEERNTYLEGVSEQFDQCQTRFENVSKQRDELQKKNSDYQLISDKLQRWMTVVREVFPDCDSEYDLKRILNEKMSIQINAVREKDQLRSQLEKVKSILSEKELQWEKNTIQITNLSKKCSEQSETIEKLQRNLLDMQNVQQSYKNVVENLRSENCADDESTKQTVAALTQHNEKIQSQLEALQLEKQSWNAEQSNFEKMLEKLETDNARLLSRVGKGEFDQSSMRVLHLAENPLDTSHKEHRREQSQKIEELETRIEELKNQLLEVQSGSSTLINVESQSKIESLELQLQKKLSILNDVEKQLEQQSTLNSRMKAVFGKKISEFRETMYKIFGYHIANIENGKAYELKHMWMSDAKHSIILQIDKMGSLHIGDTEFMRNLDPQLLVKLKQLRSVPVFLSEITLKLYNDRH